VTNNVDNVIFFVRNPLIPDTPIGVNCTDQNQSAGNGRSRYPGKTSPSFLSTPNEIDAGCSRSICCCFAEGKPLQRLAISPASGKGNRAQLIQIERLSVVGRLLASVSHELNNPLQAIQNALFLIKGDETLSEQGRQDLDIILSETERMASLLSRLRNTYRVTKTETLKRSS